MNILTLKDATLDYCSDETYHYFTINRNGEVTNSLQFEKFSVSQDEMLRRAIDLIDNFWIDETGSHYRYIHQPKDDSRLLVSDICWAIDFAKYRSQNADIVHLYYLYNPMIYILSDYKTSTMKVLEFRNNKVRNGWNFKLREGYDLREKIADIVETISIS